MLPNIVTAGELSGQAARLRHQEALHDNNNNNNDHSPCDDHDDCEDDKRGGVGEGGRRGGRGNRRQSTVASGVKYQLRPRSVQEREGSDGEWHAQGPVRPKRRPPPLSRYRRKTANARERYRMRQINSAFESLRGVLPAWVCSRRNASHMTKITTLRLASAYISSLQDILDGRAHQDTRSWVLSSLLQEVPASSKYRPQPHVNNNHGKTQPTDPGPTDAGPELVSLLGGALDDTGGPEDNLGSYLYLTTIPEAESTTLLLGCEPPLSWRAHHPAMVT